VSAQYTPQIDRMTEVQAESQAVGEFLEWLDEQRIDLCSVIPGSGHDRWAPITDGREKLLARYFDIDLNALENERRAILAAHSAAIAKATGSTS
jgi:hypothetical protein